MMAVIGIVPCIGFREDAQQIIGMMMPSREMLDARRPMAVIVHQPAQRSG